MEKARYSSASLELSTGHVEDTSDSLVSQSRQMNEL